LTSNLSHCSQCGSVVEECDSFCTNCGARQSRSYQTSLPSIVMNEVRDRSVSFGAGKTLCPRCQAKLLWFNRPIPSLAISLMLIGMIVVATVPVAHLFFSTVLAAVLFIPFQQGIFNVGPSPQYVASAVVLLVLCSLAFLGGIGSFVAGYVKIVQNQKDKKSYCPVCQQFLELE